MSWAPFLILAYVSVALQIGLGPFVAYHGASPNFVLLAAVFIAVRAPRDAALLGCFGLGVLQDMVTLQPPGLFSLSYGVMAMLVVSTQQVVYKEHPLTHFSLALVAGLITAAMILFHGLIRPPAPRIAITGAVLPAIRPSLTIELTRALYTAILAPFALGLLQKVRGVFGFQPTRRKGRMR